METFGQKSGVVNRCPIVKVYYPFSLCDNVIARAFFDFPGSTLLPRFLTLNPSR